MTGLYGATFVVWLIALIFVDRLFTPRDRRRK